MAASCFHIVTQLFQTYRRRARIIRDHYGEDPAMWGQIHELHRELQCDGMSSDETDLDLPNAETKGVRRIAKGWLNNEVSEIWRIIERYDFVSQQGQVVGRRGNKPLPRGHKARAVHFKGAMPCLPKNYYSDLWWKSLHEYEQRSLHPKPHKTLPDMVRDHFSYIWVVSFKHSM
jgi:hypothetical protein